MASSQRRPNVCFQYRDGRCTRANKCKYSHDISSPGPSGAPDPPFNTSANSQGPFSAPRNTPWPRGRKSTTKQAAQRPTVQENTQRPPGNKSESAYRNWCRNLGGGGASPELTVAEMGGFLQEAVAILETGPVGVKQSLVKDLASERGLCRIRQIVESDFTIAYSTTELGFHRHCVTFLKLVSHEEILSSLVLRADIGTIYSVIYGPGGSRGINFFQKVCEKLLQAIVFEDALAATAATLLNTIRFNQGATVQPGFNIIVQYLQTCYSQNKNQHSSFLLRSAHRDIERIKELLYICGLLSSVKSTASGPVFPAPNHNQSQQAVDLPGLYSRLGRRHDNDFEFIKDIEILPTTNEIISDRDSFLPLKGVGSRHHLHGIQRLLDSQFRLLREDTAGQLRDSVRYLLNNWGVLVKGTDEQVKKEVQRGSQLQLRVYGGARVERLRYDKSKGLEVDVSFNQPKRVVGLSKRERVEWWEGCGELADGSLLGLINEAKETTFLLVSTRTVDTEHPDPRRLDDLASNDSRALITLSLTDPNNAGDQSRIISLARGRAEGLIMVEFLGTLLGSFEPVLRALQNLQVNPDLPFAKWITPQPPGYPSGMQPVPGIRSGGTVKVPPPLYLVRNKISLDLSCIARDGQSLSISIDKPVTPQELEKKTTLNYDQCKAMVMGLQNELALIQGPPGTGKSYVGLQLVKVMLANRDQTKVGPIVCVRNTDHGLDQFIEDLLEDGVEEVVRLGSPPGNPKLKNCTLQVFNKDADRTMLEELEVKRCNQALEMVQDDLREVCDSILNPTDSKKLKNHLEISYPHYYKALYGVNDGDGSTEINNWLLGRGIQSAEGIPPKTNRSAKRLLAGQHTNIWSMSLRERAVLKKYWEKEMRDQVEYRLREALKSHTEINNTIKQQFRESDKRCLEKAHVIGVTITGLATNSELLRGLLPKVLICEDAAEALEAYALTTLLPSVQHAIFIGDHLQLRPQVSSYRLSMDIARGMRYGLDRSLFERLANERFDHGEEFPIAWLGIQHRMHPAISSLVRKTLYPELQDHDNTKLHEEVAGMPKRLFWLDHRNLEDPAGDDESGSRTHGWEIDMVIALVRHLTRQGVYGANDIAVLTPYSGQSQKLKSRLESSCELVMGEKDSGESLKALNQDVHKGRLLDLVRVSTVDKFQGDKAKVIIISLVRSNMEGDCGLLKTPNDINFLLSRARHGMYIIGDSVTACSKVPMWTKVVKLLKNDGNIGTAFPLQCVRHPKSRMYAATPEDFLRKSPQGGCLARCVLPLDCGHPCTSKCHSEPLHKATDCMKQCIRKFPECGHSCPKHCWSPCGRCTVGIANVQLLCEHVAASLSCFDALNLDQVKCSQTMTKEMPLCGHEMKVACHTDISKTQCTAICGENLPCGHQCNKQCWNCKKLNNKGDVEVDHGACGNTCGRSFITCNHRCPNVCHGGGPCSPCVRPCEIRCSHSKCPKKCNEPCPPCAEQCTWSCVHRGRCTMPCAVPCDIIPCSKRCEKYLGCGHRCPGICGEACPNVEFCKECAAPEILERTVDPAMSNAYKNVNLNEDPILFLTCGHFYSVSSLDGFMGLKKAYIIGKKGKILGPKPTSGVQSRRVQKGCPKCRSPLRDIHRYNRVVKLALLDEATRRFVESAHEVYMGLLDKVLKTVEDLEAERYAFTAANRNTGNSDLIRTSKALKQYKCKGQALLSESDAFTKVVARSEQPFNKVNSLVIDAKRQQNVTSLFGFDNAIIRTSFQHRGQSLSLRLNWAVLSNLNTICNDPSVDTYIRDELRSDIMNQVKTLKTLCIPLRQSSNEANLPLYEIEARVYHAQFVALEISHQSKGLGRLPMTKRHRHGAIIAAAYQAETKSLEECERIRIRFPGVTAHLGADIKKASELLNGVTCYSFVTTEEQKKIYQAMTNQFRGVDNWYYCTNNHPFTTGGPIGLARCPECGVQVGGRNHVTTAGVRAATSPKGQFSGTTPKARVRVRARGPAASQAPATAPQAPAAVFRAPEIPPAPAAVQVPASRAPGVSQVIEEARILVAARAPVSAQEPAPTRDLIVAQIPAVAQVPAVTQAPAVAKTPAVAQVPAVAQTSGVAQISAEARVPVATKAATIFSARARDPIVAQVSTVAQIPAEARTPVAVEVPAAAQVQVADRAPVVAQIAAPQVRDTVAQAPAATHVQAVARVPVPAQRSAADQVPEVARAPAPAQAPAATRVPVVTRVPVPAQAPAATHVPEVARAPAPAQAPAATRLPVVTRVPVPAQRSAADRVLEVARAPAPAPAQGPAADRVPEVARVPAPAPAPAQGSVVDRARGVARVPVPVQGLTAACVPIEARVPISAQRSAVDRVPVATQTSTSDRTTLAAQAPVGTYQTMASQSRETNHWYCENNHPFTVGERGLPMDLARCLECGARIGGRDPVATAGARGATNLRNPFTRIAFAARAPAETRVPAAEEVGCLASLINFMRFRSRASRYLRRE